MMARCQFGANTNGQSGVILTYPIKGYPWRRNIVKSYEFDLSDNTIGLLFSDVKRIKEEFPDQCLNNDQLWADMSEKANNITRDRETDRLCYTVGIIEENGGWEEYYSLKENSTVLLDSYLLSTISDLIKPYEKLA